MEVVKSDGEEFYQSLLKFHDLVAGLYGPNNQQVALQNLEGTIVRMVSTSSELLMYLQPRDDVLKLMVNILKSHILLYKDGGLFTALFTSNIILKTYSEDIPFNISTISNKHILEKMDEVINKLCLKIDIGKLSEVLCIIKTIVSTKLLLRNCEMTHLCLLFAKTFGSIFPHNDVNNVNLLSDFNNTIMESALYDGCLLRVGLYPGSLSKDILSKLPDKKVLLVSSSLSLSSEEFIAETGTKITVASIDHFKNNIVFNELLTFCKKLMTYASIILCQKVVHPFIKSVFRNNNILCIDRVGAMEMPRLEKLCGCKQISSLIPDKIEDYVGIVDQLEYVKINEVMYLRIISHNDACKTLLLCGKNERECEILKICYQGSMAILQDLLTHNSVIYGGGCLETKLCMELMNATFHIPDNLGCSSVLFKKVLHIVVKSLLDVAINIETKTSYFEHVVDKTFHHHWINVPSASHCCCGLIKKDEGNFTYMNFEEIISTDSCGPVSCINTGIEFNTPKADLPVSFLCHSKNVYLCNFQAAFQAAEVILRIGHRIVEI